MKLREPRDLAINPVQHSSTGAQFGQQKVNGWVKKTHLKRKKGQYLGCWPFAIEKIVNLLFDHEDAVIMQQP